MTTIETRTESTANRVPDFQEIEDNLLSGAPLTSELINHFEKLRIESKTKFEDIGYSASDLIRAENSNKDKHVSALYSLKVAYLTWQQKLSGLKNGELRECIPPPHELDPDAKTQEKLGRKRVFLLQEIYRAKNATQATENLNSLHTLLGENFKQNADSLDLQAAFQNGASFQLAKALAKAYTSAVQDLNAFWKELAGKNEEEKVQVSEEEAARCKSDVQIYEQIIIRVFELIAHSLNSATERDNADLEALIESEESMLRCCQLICLLIGNKNAFERDLDRLAIILKKCANALNLIEIKLENNEKLANFQNQVLSTVGVVAYRLIKAQSKEEAEMAGQDILNCNEAQSRTRKLLDNCIGLFGSSELPEFLQRIQRCMTGSESASPEDDTIFKSIVDPQQNQALFSTLCQNSVAHCQFFKRPLQMIEPSLSCIRTIFAIKLKAYSKLGDFQRLVDQPDERNPELEKIWAWAGNFVLQKLQSIASSASSDISMDEINAKKQELRETIESRARFLLMLGSCEVKFCEGSQMSENELKQHRFFRGLKASMGLYLFNFAMNLRFNQSRFSLLVQQFQGAKRSIEQAEQNNSIEAMLDKSLINKCTRSQLESVMSTLNRSLNAQDEDDNKKTYLVSAICRQYSVEDFGLLLRQNILTTLNDYSNPSSSFQTDQIKGQSRQALNNIVTQVLTSCSQESQIETGSEAHQLLQQISELLFANISHYLSEASQNSLSLPMSASQFQRKKTTRLGKTVEAPAVERREECFFENPVEDKQAPPEQKYRNKQVALWQSVQNLHLFAAIAQEKENLQGMLQAGLQLIMSLTTRQQPLNQLFAHRLLQSILQFSSSDENMLEDAVSDSDLTANSALPCNDSKFIQLLINQAGQETRMHFVKAEQVRTVQTLIMEGPAKYGKQKEALKSVIESAIGRIADIPDKDACTILSLAPEMTPLYVCVGSTCIDQSMGEDEDEKAMTVIGHYQDSMKRTAMNPTPAHTDCMTVKGIDAQQSGTKFLAKELSNLKAVHDASDQKCKLLKSNCMVLKNPAKLRQLMAINFDQKPELANFLLRGIAFMLQSQNQIRTKTADEEPIEDEEEEDFIDFLRREELLQDLLSKIRPEAEKPSEGLLSTEHLEQLIVLAREAQLEESKQESDEFAGGVQSEAPPKRNSFSRQMTEDPVFDENLINKIHLFFEKPASSTDCQDFSQFKGSARLEDCLNALKQNRARQILLQVQSKLPAFDQANLGCNNFQLLHDENALAAKSGFKAQMEQTQIQIKKVLVHVQANDESKSSAFVQNLLVRGHLTVHSRFDAAKTKRIGSGLLHAANLLYFSELVTELALIAENDKERPRELYDLLLTFGFGFHGDEDIRGSTKLFKAALDLLNEKVICHAAELNEEQARDLFANELINRVFFRDHQSQRMLVNNRCKDLFGIIRVLSDKFTKLDESPQKPSWADSIKQVMKKPEKKLETVLKMWKGIKGGMNYDSPIWDQLKISMVLQDKQATSQIEWGKAYVTDESAFDDVIFKKTIAVGESEESQIIMVEKNTTDQTVQVTLKNAQGAQTSILQANARRLETIKSNQITVGPGESAEIEICKSQPSVQFSGQLLFRAKMLSKDWKKLFDSSVIPSTQQVIGHKHSVLFVCENEQIFAMGKGLTGPQDRGWLREIKKPADCTNFKKVIHSYNFRMILTEEGKVFVNGLSTSWKGYKVKNNQTTLINLFTLCGEDPEQSKLMVGKIEETALHEFKEVNIAQDFPDLEAGDKIVDFCTSFGRTPEMTLFAIVTQNGKLYLRSDDLCVKPPGPQTPWKLTAEDKKRSTKGDKESFQILQLKKGTEDYSKVEKVFANRNLKDGPIAFYATASNGSGEKVTFGIGQLGCIEEPDRRAKTAIGHIDLKKEGLHFTKMCFTKGMHCALDNENGVWLWGDPPKAKTRKLYYSQDCEEGSDAEEDKDGSDAGEDKDGSDAGEDKDGSDGENNNDEDIDVDKPAKLRYFKDNGFKILDIEAGTKALIIKVEDQDQKQHFFGMPYRPYDVLGSEDEDDNENRRTDSDDEDNQNSAAVEDEKEEEKKAVAEKISVDDKAINMIGIDSSEDCFTGGILYKLAVKEGAQTADISRVQSFGCSSNAAFFCLKSRASEEEEQKEPVASANQNLDDYFHYYRQAESQWKELTKAQYAQEKSLPEFPDICLATRYRMDINSEKIKTYLNSLWDQTEGISFCASDTAVHPVTKTQSLQVQRDISSEQPLYYSHSKISSKSQKITARESEFCEGGQTWGLNPLVFYRLKRPVEDLSQLPEIKLDDIYEQNAERSRQIMIQVRKKNLSDKEVEEALEKVSDATKETILSLTEFTDSEDAQILKQMERTMKSMFPDADKFLLQDIIDEKKGAQSNDKDASSLENLLHTDFILSSGQFNLASQDFSAKSSVSCKENRIINMRVELLLKLNMYFYRLFKFVNHEFRLHPETNHGKHYALKDKVMETLRFKLIQEQLAQVPRFNSLQGSTEVKPEIPIRKKMVSGGEDENHDFSGSENDDQTSIFDQFVCGLQNYKQERIVEETEKQKKKYDAEVAKLKKAGKEIPPFELKPETARYIAEDPMSLEIFRVDSQKAQPFKVTYPDQLTGKEEVKEKKKKDGDVLDLGGGYRDTLTSISEELVETGEDRKVKCLKKCANSELFRLNEEATDEQDRELFIMLGALLAFAFLSGQCFGIQVAQSVWKQILGDKLLIQDVLEVDEQAYLLLSSQNPSDESGAENPKLDKAVNSYFAKYKPQVEAIKKGMNEVLKGKLNVIAYLPLSNFEERICGRPTVEIEDLKKIMKFENPRVPEQEEWYWQILGEFDQHQRAQYLMFVNAKSRLPKELDSVEHAYQVYLEERGTKSEKKLVDGKIVRLHDVPYVKNQGDSLPRAHTCTFKVDMMLYSSLDIMREKLLYAMQNATGIED